MTMGVYSPKIYEQVIPTLYRLAKLKGVSMTRLVNMILVRELMNSGHIISWEGGETYDDKRARTHNGL